MKILCPIDFSDSSINAAKWILSYLDKLGGGKLEFLHCINLRSRSSMFLKMDDILKERAGRDMQELIDTLSKESTTVSLSSKIAIVDPKSYISQYATKEEFEWIVLGTQGLTALKDITVGSVTEYLINKSSKTVLSIPAHSAMSDIKVVVLGIDADSAEDETAIKSVIELCLKHKATLQLVHFRSKDRDPSVIPPAFFVDYEYLDWKFEEKDSQGELAGELNTYCDSVGADLLCLVHHRRNWWRRVFTKSLSKSELFKLKLPLLIPGS